MIVAVPHATQLKEDVEGTADSSPGKCLHEDTMRSLANVCVQADGLAEALFITPQA